MKALPKRHSQRGQFTIEAMLIMTLLLGFSLSLAKKAKEGEWMKSFIEGPWKPLQGMIEDGVWIAAGNGSKQVHPHVRARHATIEGDRL